MMMHALATTAPFFDRRLPQKTRKPQPSDRWDDDKENARPGRRVHWAPTVTYYRADGVIEKPPPPSRLSALWLHLPQ